MPETNTEELIKELLKLLPNVKIIAVTGVGISELENWRPKLESYGIKDIVLKPFDSSKLIEIIKDLL